MDGITTVYNGNHFNYTQYIVYDEETEDALGVVNQSVHEDEKPYGAMGLVIPGEERKYFGWHETFEQAVAAVVLGLEIPVVDVEHEDMTLEEYRAWRDELSRDKYQHWLD